VRLVAEELVADQLLLVVDVLLDTVRQHHVVQSLVRVTGGVRVLANQLEVLLEGAFPGELFVGLEVLELGDLSHETHALDRTTRPFGRLASSPAQS
jgi:hypothetical protein